MRKINFHGWQSVKNCDQSGKCRIKQTKIIIIMKVRNMTSSKGNDIPNQFIVETNEGIFFQSYNSVIAVKRNDGSIELDKRFWDYSTTTGKYRNQFLCETKKETEQKIKAGIYKLVDLN